MTRAVTPKVGAYAGLAALGLLAALALDLPELAVLAAPFAVVVAIALVMAEEPSLELELTLDRERVLEGDEVDVRLRVVAGRPVALGELLLELPDGLAPLDGGARSALGGTARLALHLRAGEERELALKLRGARWGGYRVGVVHLRARDPLAFLQYEARFDRRVPLKVYPRPEEVERLLRPLETQVFAGNQVSRDKGDGIEFADLRPFVAGDRIRRVNWRASARRGDLWVNELHAERNADVVLFVDSFGEASRARARTLDHAVRAAAGLAQRYLREKDRVGFVSFGGVLNWLLPGTGAAHLYRIVDALIDTEILLSHAWRDLDVLPRRTLPPRALVVALTPLLDERSVGALLDLHARGFDLAVVEISPEPFVDAGRGEVERLAYRIWRLQRAALRGRLERAGVAVATWDDEVDLVAALEEVRSFRRHAPRARAF